MPTSLPEVMPVASAAKYLGISGRVMRRWLEIDLGYVFRGKRKLVRVEDVAKVLYARLAERKHRGRLDRWVRYTNAAQPRLTVEEMLAQGHKRPKDFKATLNQAIEKAQSAAAGPPTVALPAEGFAKRSRDA